MTHPSATLGFSHLFSAALAELALHLPSLQYLGKVLEKRRVSAAKVWVIRKELRQLERDLIVNGQLDNRWRDSFLS